MTRNNAILWFARIATMIFTFFVVLYLASDQELSRSIRLATVGIVFFLVMTILSWQVVIAWRYDGLPIIPLSFRWVVATWFGSLALFLLWIISIAIVDRLYTHIRSAVMYWQFGVATLWFASRWMTIEAPHKAGLGETGGNIDQSGNISA